MTTHDFVTDFYTWTQRQAAALRAKEFAALDLEHLAEEIADLGQSIENAIESHLERLLLHLLKWRHQPERRSDSWANTIGRERDNIEVQLEDSPGLKPRREALFARAYQLARREAARGTGLPAATFPAECPFTLEQATDEGFWPEAGGGAAGSSP